MRILRNNKHLAAFLSGVASLFRFYPSLALEDCGLEEDARNLAKDWVLVGEDLPAAIRQTTNN